MVFHAEYCACSFAGCWWLIRACAIILTQEKEKKNWWGGWNYHPRHSFTNTHTTHNTLPVMMQYLALVVHCAALLKLADMVHLQMHTDHSWMEDWIPGFQSLRAMHFWHHVGRSNFGIASFWFDALFLGVRLDKGEPWSLAGVIHSKIM